MRHCLSVIFRTILSVKMIIREKINVLRMWVPGKISISGRGMGLLRPNQICAWRMKCSFKARFCHYVSPSAPTAALPAAAPIAENQAGASPGASPWTEVLGADLRVPAAGAAAAEATTHQLAPLPPLPHKGQERETISTPIQAPSPRSRS